MTDSSPLPPCHRRCASRPRDRRARSFRGQMRLDPQDHVADVVHPLAKKLLLDLRELGGVAVHDHLQGRQGRQLLVLDQRADLRAQRRVVDDLQVALEDLGLGGARAPGRPCWTIASSSAAGLATARSNRSISAATRLGLSRVCCSNEPNTDSTRWATPTTTPGLTPIPLRMTSPSHGSVAIA